LSGLDFVVIIIVIIGGVKGYRDGFLLELFSLLGIILGVLGAFKLLGLTLIFLTDHFDIDKKILPYVAFGVVFIAIVIIVSLIGRALRASIDKSFLGRVDQAAGAGLGLVKTVFMASVLLWLIDSFHVEFPDNWTKNSIILPYVEDFAPKVTAWIGDLIPAFNDIF
jgi:membrane protein required for colicin V production